jgi:hypothetical protein
MTWPTLAAEAIETMTDMTSTATDTGYELRWGS